MVREDIYYVRHGLSTTPTYAGTFKGGGAAYPAFGSEKKTFDQLLDAKETIGVTAIPLRSLVFCQPDVLISGSVLHRRMAGGIIFGARVLFSAQNPD
jgi:hypothetical protein